MSSGYVPGPVPAADQTDDDDSLMRGIAAGDATALSRLYDRHSPLVFAFCLRSLRDRAEAEDVVVDIFWEIWDRHDRYDADRSSPRTYLMTLTRSRIIDRLRALRSRRLPAPPARGANASGGTAPPEVPPAAASLAFEPLHAVVAGEERERVREALRQLTPDQRTALELTYFEAMTNAEVAQRLGQPLGTVKSRIRQALIRLREMLQGGDP